MSRISDGATRSFSFASGIGPALLAVIAALSSTGCKDIDGRNGNRTGNRMFREMQFVDAAAAYEQSLKQVEHPTIHYNLGLAYSKVYRPGMEKPILLGETVADKALCDAIPNTKPVKAQVCVKKPDAEDQSGRRAYIECDPQNPCSSSFDCKQTELCTSTSAELADLAATHLQAWIKTQPDDEWIAAELKKVRDASAAEEKRHTEERAAIAPTNTEALAAEDTKSKNRLDELSHRSDELQLKDEMRKLATGVWLDTNQYDKALKYWEGELAAKPNNSAIIGNIAGIHLRANDWETSIKWYLKQADVETDPVQKVAALNSIGNVAWSKLNSKTLTNDENVKIADFAIGALQKAAELAKPMGPKKLGSLYGLQASIFTFRSMAQGASFAAAIDRSNGQDLLKLARVLLAEAKTQQSGTAPAPGATTPPGSPAPPAPASPASPTPAPPGGKTGG